AVLAGELRAPKVERLGRIGEGCERIESRRSIGHVLELGEVFVQLVYEGLEELLLQRQRALARGERLVLESLELRGDEALRVLHRLAPLVLDGHLVELALR